MSQCLCSSYLLPCVRAGTRKRLPPVWKACIEWLLGSLKVKRVNENTLTLSVSLSLSFLSCSPCLLKQVFLSSNFKIKASDLLVNALPTKQLNLTLLCIVTVNSFIYLRWTNFIMQIREYSGTSPTLLLSLSLWIVVMACFQFIAQAQAQLFIMWRMQKMTSRKKEFFKSINKSC